MALLDVLSGSRRRGSGMSPLTMGLIGLLAYRTLKGKGRLADMLGRAGSGGGAGNALSGAALSGGLKDLLERFRQSGQEDKAQSWVSTGPNRTVAPNELEQALGAERVQWLMEQTGMSKEELLTGLSGELPDAVDELTPDGEIPTQQELERRVT
jgi:uncharacterized protein YidB (DUF937 family)